MNMLYKMILYIIIRTLYTFLGTEQLNNHLLILFSIHSKMHSSISPMDTSFSFTCGPREGRGYEYLCPGVVLSVFAMSTLYTNNKINHSYLF